MFSVLSICSRYCQLKLAYSLGDLLTSESQPSFGHVEDFWPNFSLLNFSHLMGVPALLEGSKEGPALLIGARALLEEPRVAIVLNLEKIC